MRDIPAEIITALDSANFRPLFLVEILFDTPLHFSSAFGEITINSTTYFGAANLGSISSFKENSDLDPQQLEITLAGVSDASLSAIGTSNYLNRDVFVRVAMIAEDGSIIGSGAMDYFIGKTDEVRFTYDKQGAITVVARDKLSDWSRPKVERNVNADHQARYPGDKGFEFVSQVADKDIVWPTGEFFE